MPTERAGFTLIELLVVMSLTAILSAVLFGTLLTQMHVARVVVDRTSSSDAVRSTAAVVGGEVRRMLPHDVRAAANDSLAVRAFRGLAFLCDSDAGVIVRYRGDRLPDPTKDSVLVVRPGGQAVVLLLGAEAAPAGSCAADADDRLLTLRVEGGAAAVEGAAALLTFEAGNYYLAARALRYRLGGEGRQPLTAERFLHPGTGFRPAADGSVIGLELTTSDRSRTLRPLSFSPSVPGSP